MIYVSLADLQVKNQDLFSMPYNILLKTEQVQRAIVSLIHQK
jgi:hypothetical protein